MITTEDVLLGLMEELGWDYITWYSVGKRSDRVFIFENYKISPNSFEISPGNWICPEGAIVRSFRINGRKISWEYQDKKTEIDLIDPESVDKILQYVTTIE